MMLTLGIYMETCMVMHGYASCVCPVYFTDWVLCRYAVTEYCMCMCGGGIHGAKGGRDAKSMLQIT